MKYINFKFFVFLCFAAPLAFALPSKDVQDSLDEQMENLTSRRGLEIGGTVRSVMVRSALSSPQDINNFDKSPAVERAGFSQFDLSLKVRPYDIIGATAILRFSAEYQEYFDFGHKTVAAPWINMYGQIGNNFYWVVGDFRTSYSHLSIYSPDVEILYEPQIYARSRYMARDQVFLQGNNRNLQGANLQYRNDFGGILGELRAEAIFSRLRRVEMLDYSGYMGNILPNEQDKPGASQASGMDKLLYSANLEWLTLNKNIFVGLTPIFIKDIVTSKTQVYLPAAIGEEAHDINPGVYGPENTQIFNARVGADIAGIISNPNLIANLTVEGAMSKDTWYSAPGESQDLDGMAILANAVAGYKNADNWMGKVDINFIMNDSAWYNPLAQSPAFFARRVMNSDKDNFGASVKYGSKSPFYSSFDALYHFSPKFVPVARNLAPISTIDGTAQAESYNLAPFSKNSYNTAVYTRDELALLQSMIDPILQGTLPNGLASANRVGPKANLTLGYGKDNAFEVQGIFAMLKENTASVIDSDVAEFTEFGGGLKADIGSFLWEAPLELSGSFKKANAKRGDLEFNSDFINAGFYARYFKRFGVSAGMQRITTDNVNYSRYFPVKGEQFQWMAGLDYTLAKNAWVAINYGQIKVTNTYNDNYDTVADKKYLPLYITEMMKEKNTYGDVYMSGDKIKHEFTQNLVEASINMSF